MLQIHDQTRLDSVLALPGISQAKDDPDCARFTVIEAKKLSPEKHEAQTVGENLVV